MHNTNYIYFDIFLRSFPFLLFAFSYYGYRHVKIWVPSWKISKRTIKKILFFYKSLMVLFVLPWIVFLIYGLESNVSPSFWIKMVFLYPAYIWHLTHIAFFLIVVPYDLIKLFIHFLWYLKGKMSKQNQTGGIDQSKRELLHKSAFLLPATFFTINTIGVYGSEFDIATNKIPIKIKNLSENLKGLTITQISDIHFGPFMGAKKFSMFAKIVNDLKSDFIMITGDILNSSEKLISTAMSSLLQLRAVGGIYACLGNHEYFTGVLPVKKAFDQVGMHFLINESRIIQFNDAEFTLMGVDYPIARSKNTSKIMQMKSDMDLTLQGIEKKELPKILLAHHPHTFYESVKHNIDLTLSGHTHGGQIVFGDSGHFEFSLGSIGYRYVKGYYSNGDSHLYVNSGLGHWLPMRFNCPPEITRFTLE